MTLHEKLPSLWPHLPQHFGGQFCLHERLAVRVKFGPQLGVEVAPKGHPVSVEFFNVYVQTSHHVTPSLQEGQEGLVSGQG